MTLGHFKRLTAHLDEDLELLCAGAELAIVWHDDQYLSFDDGDPELDDSAVVLWDNVGGAVALQRYERLAPPTAARCVTT